VLVRALQLNHPAARMVSADDLAEFAALPRLERLALFSSRLVDLRRLRSTTLIDLRIQETNWEDAPVLSDKSVRHVLGGRPYDFYFNGPKLHMIVLRENGATYWIVNSLLDNVSNETMIAIAKGLRPLKGAK